MDQKTGTPPEVVSEAPKAKAAKKKAPKRKPKRKIADGKKGRTTHERAKFPRHSVEKALRIPRAIIEQNAGKDCTDRESAKFVGVGFAGPYAVEISPAIKYGFL